MGCSTREADGGGLRAKVGVGCAIRRTYYIFSSSPREVEQYGLHHLERERWAHGGEGGVGLYHVKEQRPLWRLYHLGRGGVQMPIPPNAQEGMETSGPVLGVGPA